ncbi:MAG TPA: tetratricopeptide repeat protein, partial [Gemmatimonadota bacterium]|nr:tetratricopeptide repeat protein [Gemmatimonadota bacterium]
KETAPAEAFDEYVLNSLGYRLLGADRFDDAIRIFTLNVEEYPGAWNPYDSLGEAYMRAGNLEMATAYYEKSLELNPDNSGGRAMLERIRAQLAGAH